MANVSPTAFAFRHQIMQEGYHWKAGDYSHNRLLFLLAAWQEYEDSAQDLGATQDFFQVRYQPSLDP